MTNQFLNRITVVIDNEGQEMALYQVGAKLLWFTLWSPGFVAAGGVEGAKRFMREEYNKWLARKTKHPAIRRIYIDREEQL